MAYIMWAVLAILALVLLLNFKKVIPKLKIWKVFFEEVSFEMTKVTWPTRDEVINSTVLVIVVAILLIIMTGLMDAIYSRLVQFMF
jgi:preprotein translocase subunit SecE